ncbi:MAG: hypothetical protein IPN20_25490 [Haliscomenobacter sp.]|nr:hypothetical protein [Haliscomenobacter sp.]
MLLACEKCNNAKSNKPSDETIHYLPEYHNGLLVFEAATTATRTDALIVGHRATLNAAQQTKAKATISLFEWENVDTRGAVVDIRWFRRHKAHIVVLATKRLFEKVKLSPTYDPDEAGKDVATLSIETGFFMLWFHEFANEPHVLKWLIHPDVVPGVRQSCFDATTFSPIDNPAYPI